METFKKHLISGILKRFMDPIKIPQNVYVEDRIFGPITLRQIILTGIGGGISYAMWALFNQAYGSVPLPVMAIVLIPVIVSIIFGFVKINDLSMARVILLLIERMSNPNVRTWSPRQGLEIHIRTFTPVDESKRKQQVAEKQGKERNLDDLSSILDARLDKDHDEADAAQQAMEQAQATVQQPEPRTTEPVQKSRVSVFPPAEQKANDQQTPFTDVRPSSAS